MDRHDELRQLIPRLRAALERHATPTDPRRHATTAVIDLIEVAADHLTITAPLHELGVLHALDAAHAGLNFVHLDDPSLPSERIAELHETPRRLLAQLVHLGALDEEALLARLTLEQLDALLGALPKPPGDHTPLGHAYRATRGVHA